MIDQQLASIISTGNRFAIIPHAEAYKGYAAFIDSTNEENLCSSCHQPHSGDWDSVGHGFTMAEAIKNEIDRWHGRAYRKYSSEEFLK